jgi:hypothetical protein
MLLHPERLVSTASCGRAITADSSTWSPGYRESSIEPSLKEAAQA